MYPNAPRVVIRDVVINGPIPAATGWKEGIYLYDTEWFSIDNVFVVGRITNKGITAADVTHMLNGIHIANGAFNIGAGWISHARIYSALNGRASCLIRVSKASTLARPILWVLIKGYRGIWLPPAVG